MKLNIGAGKNKITGFVSIDKADLKETDIRHDLDKYPYPITSNSVTEIYAENIVEHIENLPKFMEEIHRITKNQAKIIIIVPYYNYHGAYRDPTHKHFFTADSMEYYTEQSRLKYYSKARFKIKKIKLIPTMLGKIIPSPIRNYIGMIIGEIIKEIQFELETEK